MVRHLVQVARQREKGLDRGPCRWRKRHDRGKYVSPHHTGDRHHAPGTRGKANRGDWWYGGDVPELPDLVHVEAVLRRSVCGLPIVDARVGDPVVLRLMVPDPFPAVLVHRRG